MKNSSFTRAMLSIAIPVTLQNLLFSSYTLADTIMVGSLGDVPLAAVSMAGKWSWFLGIVLFGFTSGAAVFIAQYFGANDTRGIHRAYGVMTIGSVTTAIVFMLLALIMPERILGLFTKDPLAIETGSKYLRIVCIAFPFQALRRSAGTLLQSTQEVVIPFLGAFCSVVTNIPLNAVLIFGLFGAPALGVEGAAIASVIAAIVDLSVIFILGFAKKTALRVPVRNMIDIHRGFAMQYLRVGMPTMINETVWALSNLIFSAIFGHMGTQAYAAVAVVKSLEDLTCVAIFGLGSSAAVLIGNYIGQGKIDEGKRCAWYHLKLTVLISVVTGLAVVALRVPIMRLFGVSDMVRTDAQALLMIYGFDMILRNLPYMMVVGIFRAGGDTKIGLIVDAVCAYGIVIPLTAYAGLVLHLSVPATYLIMYLVEDVLKVLIYGRYMLSYKWIKPVV